MGSYEAPARGGVGAARSRTGGAPTFLIFAGARRGPPGAPAAGPPAVARKGHEIPPRRAPGALGLGKAKKK